MCHVDKISSPCVTANSRDQPWMTSAHATLPDDLEVKPTPCYSMGNAAAKWGNTLRNPFFYVFAGCDSADEVVTLLTRCEFLSGSRMRLPRGIIESDGFASRYRILATCATLTRYRARCDSADEVRVFVGFPHATASWNHGIGRLRISLSDLGDMCHVDKISSPCVTANSRDQPWMTSAHATLPDDLEVKPTPCYSSGQCSSEMGQHAKEPLFLRLAGCDSADEVRVFVGFPHATASWNHGIGRLRISLSDLGDMCHVDKISSPCVTANSRDHPWMTSAHATLPDDLEVKPTPCYSSCDSADEVRVFVGFPHATASWNHGIGRLRISLSDLGDMCHVDKISSPCVTANSRDQPWMTSAHATLPDDLEVVTLLTRCEFLSGSRMRLPRGIIGIGRLRISLSDLGDMCHVDKISSPCVTANSRDQPWMTSAHATLPDDLEVKPTPCYSSCDSADEVRVFVGFPHATASWNHGIGRLRISLSDLGDMCHVDKISSPCVTANSRDQPWMTSAHATLPDDLEVKPTPCYSSGQCSSEMGQHAKEPLFLRLSGCDSADEVRVFVGFPHATASWNHGIGRLRISLSDLGDMCHVDKISSPCVTANSRDQPWMTSAHATLPDDLEVKPTPCYSSGQCSSEMGQHAKEPLFLRLSGCDSADEVRVFVGFPHATAAWNHRIGRLRISLSDLGDMCHVDKISSPCVTANSRDQPWMTSAHATLPDDLEVKPTPCYSSGQCSSEMGQHAKEPLFLRLAGCDSADEVRVFVGFPHATASWNHGIGRLRISLSDLGDMCHVDKISSPCVTANSRDQPWMTSAHATLPDDLEVKPTPCYSSGQCSSEMGQHAKEPLFLRLAGCDSADEVQFLSGSRMRLPRGIMESDGFASRYLDLGDMCHVDKISSPCVTANSRDQPWMTSAHATLPDDLEVKPTPCYSSGQCSSEMGQHAKEPLFLRLCRL
ncbi:hypothetical protein MTO96_049712 [Rhipicephalus appendiculatus]